MSQISNLYWKLWKSYENPGCVSMFRELENEARLSSEQWISKRDCRLQSFLKFAFNEIPYYQSLFQSVGFDPKSPSWKAEFSRVPVLTKQLVRENTPNLRNSSVEIAHKNSTGGSTGQPLHFYQCNDYRMASVALDAHVRTNWGVGPIDRTANIWGADIDFQDQSFRKRFYDWRSRLRGLNAFKMNREELIGFLKMLATWNPPYLMGYSSALEVLAEAALESGIDTIRFKAIRSSAEKLWPHQREKIESAFKSPVLDFYGSREINNIAAECVEKNRMHLVSTLRYVEITGDSGQPVAPGEPGFVTVTDLTNRAMPFVRYRNDDMATFSETRCSCGKPSPVIESLLGRSTDIIHSSRGDMVHGEFFTHLFYDLPNVREFQVRQTEIEKILIAYVGSEPLADKQKQNLVEKVQQKMGCETAIEFSQCDSIPRLPSGKHRFTVCEIDRNQGNPLDVQINSKPASQAQEMD